MLTTEEQEAILKRARALARRHLEVRRRLEHSEVSPQRAKELIEQAEEELRDTLKEVG
jgi:hypothetical protein